MIGRLCGAWLLLGVATVAAPAGAVGLGPLAVNGTIDGPREGFMLDLYNPYDMSMTFVAYAVGIENEQPQVRVSVLPADAELGPRHARKVLVIADDLQVGEIYRFRVCAQRKAPPEGIQVNARVCSKITAHRIS